MGERERADEVVRGVDGILDGAENDLGGTRRLTGGRREKRLALGAGKLRGTAHRPIGVQFFEHPRGGGGVVALRGDRGAHRAGERRELTAVPPTQLLEREIGKRLGLGEAAIVGALPGEQRREEPHLLVGLGAKRFEIGGCGGAVTGGPKSAEPFDAEGHRGRGGVVAQQLPRHREHDRRRSRRRELAPRRGRDRRRDRAAHRGGGGTPGEGAPPPEVGIERSGVARIQLLERLLPVCDGGGRVAATEGEVLPAMTCQRDLLPRLLRQRGGIVEARIGDVELTDCRGGGRGRELGGERRSAATRELRGCRGQSRSSARIAGGGRVAGSPGQLCRIGRAARAKLPLGGAKAPSGSRIAAKQSERLAEDGGNLGSALDRLGDQRVCDAHAAGGLHEQPAPNKLRDVSPGREGLDDLSGCHGLADRHEAEDVPRIRLQLGDPRLDECREPRRRLTRADLDMRASMHNLTGIDGALDQHAQVQGVAAGFPCKPPNVVVRGRKAESMLQQVRDLVDLEAAQLVPAQQPGGIEPAESRRQLLLGASRRDDGRAEPGDQAGDGLCRELVEAGCVIHHHERRGLSRTERLHEIGECVLAGRRCQLVHHRGEGAERNG